MLEPCVSQAAGLQSLALQWVPRLVAVTSHGQQQGEMPVLWGLCTRWVDMGLSVIVLDGRTEETLQNPGLAQLIDNPLVRNTHDKEQSSWSILPAAQGFAKLAAGGLFASPVGEWFKNYAVVLVYTSADCMTSLLKGGALAPLLVVPPAMSSALTAYQALKQLLTHGQLSPTVANIVLETKPTMSQKKSNPADNVASCANAYLGYKLTGMTINASAKAGFPQDALDKLATQLLENAVPLERHPIERVH